MTTTSARVIYPELPDPLTPSDLQQLFSPSFDERQWALIVARTVEWIKVAVHRLVRLPSSNAAKKVRWCSVTESAAMVKTLPVVACVQGKHHI